MMYWKTFLCLYRPILSPMHIIFSMINSTSDINNMRTRNMKQLQSGLILKETPLKWTLLRKKDKVKISDRTNGVMSLHANDAKISNYGIVMLLEFSTQEKGITNLRWQPKNILIEAFNVMSREDAKSQQ